MWIRYFVPEDGDDAAHPNVFNLTQNETVSLKIIREKFPIKGEFHFRFLKAVGNLTVWMDAEDIAAAIPPYQGSIYIKASRISIPASSSTTPKVTEKKVSNIAADLPPKNVPAKEPQEKLLNLNDEPVAANHNNAPANSSTSPFFEDNNDLLGFTSSPTVTSAPKSNPSVDPFGLDTLQPMSTSTPMMRPGNNPAGMNPMQSNVGNAFQSFGNMPMGGQPPRGGPMNSMGPGVGAPRPQMQANYDPFGGLGSTGTGNGQQYNQYPRRNF